MKTAFNSNMHGNVYLVGGGIASLASAAYFIDKKPTPMYHGDHHPGILFDAMKTMLR